MPFLCALSFVCFTFTQWKNCIKFSRISCIWHHVCVVGADMNYLAYSSLPPFQPGTPMNTPPTPLTPLPPKPAAACVGSSTDMWASWCCYLSLPPQPFSFSNFLQFAPYNTHLTFYKSIQNLSFFLSSPAATLWFSPTCLKRSLDQLCVGKCGVCDADLRGSSYVSAWGTKSFALTVGIEKNQNLNATTRNLSTCL